MESFLNRKVSRKSFIKIALAFLALLPFAGLLNKETAAAADSAKFNGRPRKGIKGDYDLVIAKGDDPYLLTVKAVEAMGGMERFVRKNSVVVVKPNIGWDRTPEQAANTNPLVVAALVELSFKAGAKKVKVFDVTCNDARRCYANSGIEKAAKEKGADVFFTDDWDTIAARFDYDSPMEKWPMIRDAVECDTFINCPVLKHHGLAGLTLSMKNLMGVCGGNRGLIHRDIGEKLVDLAYFMNPDLNIIDAYRVLLRNGPTGGNLKDVMPARTVIASTDTTLADTYACTIVNTDPLSIPNIAVAAERKFGSIDIEKASRKYIEV
ncbi:MAG: DUF362 domain-containing protein [Candidatus Omnitrophota bacterium]